MAPAEDSVASDVVVVGAGIVGLAVAREIALRGGRSVRVLEAEDEIAAHQTGRNSGVIHAGLYYRPGSEKARLCAAGRTRLYAYCERKGIPTRQCGKLVVATSPQELDRLDDLVRRGEANGLSGLERLTPREIRDREPEATGLAGLWVPATGVVDYRRVAESFAEDLLGAAGDLRREARVTGLESNGSGLIVKTSAGEFRCRSLVNCAGLESDRIARLAGVEPDLRIVPFRGEYYRLAPRLARRIRGLIYPVPDPALPFLGVHFTRTISDDVLIGPNAVPALSRTGYRRADLSLRDLAAAAGFRGTWLLGRRLWRVGARELIRTFSRRAFLAGARKLVPKVTAADLEPAPSGVRAQAVGGDGELIDDFRFARAGRSLHVLNAPSPAATSALAIARVVADQLQSQGPGVSAR